MADALRVNVIGGFPTAESIATSENKSDLDPFYRHCADRTVQVFRNPDMLAALEALHGCSFEDWRRNHYQNSPHYVGPMKEGA